jgi:hypothetical protein
MTGTRRRRRDEAEAAAEARFTDRIGAIFDLHLADALPPLSSVGWREPGQVGGGLLYCLACCPTQPTARHVAVFHDSYYFATLSCVVCGRRLDSRRA